MTQCESESCEQFTTIKRLCDKIIGSVIERVDFLKRIAACRKHDNRHVHFLPNHQKHVLAVDVWQSQVQYNECRLLSAGQFESIRSIVSRLDPITSATQ